MLAVGVVIVAFNSSETIRECLTSCLADPAVAFAVVVDNANEASCRRIVEALAVQDPRVRYVPSDNVGFSRGCNRGADLISSCDALAFINPDVKVTRSLGELATRLDRSRYAIMSGRLMVPEHPTAVNARPRVSMRRELVASLVGGGRAYALKSASAIPTHGQEIEVGQVAGAMLLISRLDFEQLRGFDEQFELYYEDVDLAARALDLGGSVLINEEWGIHDAGKSAVTVSSMAYCVFTISRARFLRKRYGRHTLTSLGVLAIACTELVSRSLTRQREGQAARNQAFFLQLRELKRAGSVRILK